MSPVSYSGAHCTGSIEIDIIFKRGVSRVDDFNLDFTIIDAFL